MQAAPLRGGLLGKLSLRAAGGSLRAGHSGRSPQPGVVCLPKPNLRPNLRPTAGLLCGNAGTLGVCRGGEGEEQWWEGDGRP